MHPDKIENFNGAVIQHGPYNNRIYLMHCPFSPNPDLAADLIGLAQEKGYTKIFIKVPESVSNRFFLAGFEEEARIPGFYSTGESTVFMAFYPDRRRCCESRIETYKLNLKKALDKKDEKILDLDQRYRIRKCVKADLSRLAGLYQRTFASYPFPIHDPDYLFQTMRSDVEYFCIAADGKIVAASAAELDRENLNAEMTDFATLTGWRAKKLAQHLLAFMERQVRQQRIKTVYTIARAFSAGINITFSKSGYHFAGRLKNNTNIAGSIESMNVWYKNINDGSDEKTGVSI